MRPMGADSLSRILKLHLASISVCPGATKSAPRPATTGTCTTTGHGVLARVNWVGTNTSAVGWWPGNQLAHAAHGDW